jgi:hypothetical protein
MNNTMSLGRSLLVVCLLGLLAACGGGEHGAASDTDGHGHSHD